MIKKLLIALFIFALGLGTGVIFSEIITNFVVRLFPETNTEKEKAKLTVTFNELMSDFAANDSLANVKYGNNIITVKGIAKQIVLKDSAAIITMSDSMETKEATFDFQPQNVAEVKNLKESSEVSIKAFCTGKLKKQQPAEDGEESLFDEIEPPVTFIRAIINK
jgi:hypothetical protein